MWVGEASLETLNDTSDHSDVTHTEQLKTGADWPNGEITSSVHRVFRPTESCVRSSPYPAYPALPCAPGVLKIQPQLIRFYPAERFCVQLHMVLI